MIITFLKCYLKKEEEENCVKETVCGHKPKIFTISPFTEKVCKPLF